MTTILRLGVEPQPLIVDLTAGSDFEAVMEYETQVDGVWTTTDWPVGTVLTLEFDDPAATTFPATVAGSQATFSQDGATTSIPARANARVRYVNGTTNRVLFKGEVRQHG